jgi:hypothetical protein
MKTWVFLRFCNYIYRLSVIILNFEYTVILIYISYIWKEMLCKETVAQFQDIRVIYISLLISPILRKGWGTEKYFSPKKGSLGEKD